MGSFFSLCYELSHPTENEIQKARYLVSEKKLQILGKSIDWPSQPTSYMTFQEVTEAVAMGRKLVVVGNRVCDVSEFQKDHPGGTGLIQSMIGKEPDTTLKAMSGRHTHTKAAKNLMDILTVALLKEN